MLANFWYYVLYQPLFNALIYLYNTIAGQNLGWAVVELTIGLRIVMLPLTIISERNAIRQTKANIEAEKAIESYKGDRVKQKEVARAIMRKYRISPWAKVLQLGIQLLVLILLYQVFIRGITGEKIMKILYPGIDFPGTINTSFFGFDIGRLHDSIWAGAAAVYLVISIYIEKKREHKHWERSDVFYMLAFPGFTFLALWLLPMVKSIFILTTMIFSDTIRLLRVFFVYLFKSAKKE